MPRPRLIGKDQRVMGREQYRIVSGLTRIGSNGIRAGNVSARQVRTVLGQEERSDISVCPTAVENVDFSNAIVADVVIRRCADPNEWRSS